jgi:hypothetical protein
MEPQASPQEVLWITDTEYGPRSIASLFTVTASDIRIHDLAIENVPGAAFVVVGGAGDGVTGVEIVRTTVQGLGRNSFSDGIILLGCSNSEGGFLSDVLIEENVLRDVHAGVVAFAGNALGRGQSARRCRLERLTIAENRIERPLTGIIAYAAQASLEAAAEENRLAEVGIVDNVIDAPLDVGILLSSTQPFAAATNARNRIESVRIAGNAISSPVDLDRGNTGLFLTGGQTFAGGASVEDAVTNLLIEDNRVEGVATAVLLVAGDAERCGPCETRASTLDGVTMRRNTWHARATGVLVAGGASFEAAGLVSGNRLGNVVLEDEEIEAGLVGVLVAGGVAASLPLGGNFLASGVRFPGYQEPGEITDSRVVGFALRRSTIRALDAVVLQGGSVTATEDTVRASGVERISLEDNLIEGERSHVAAFGGVVVDAGRVEGCAITSLVEAANRSQAGEAVTALIVQEVASGAAPQSSVVGNRVVP